ncbi:MAG: molybdopterin-dependent oxidoreductase [Rhodoferax sp.]
MSDKISQTPVSRRRILQTSAAAAGATSLGGVGYMATLQKAHAGPEAPKTAETVITKSFCNQCSASCGIDVYTTNGRVHAIYGTLDNPLSNGKLCPKGHYGMYILYDPDRFKGPMKRTNPKKGRQEDPGFVPISWDEALGIVAARLNALRDKGESHRFSVLVGREWGKLNADLLTSLGQLYGTPNIGINHGSISADTVKKARLFTDGNYGYYSYDYANTNYMLVVGTSFLEAGRPLNGNMQAWGVMRSKAPRTKVTAVNVHTSTSTAAADRQLLIKPGTDGALALALAHVILTEGMWDRKFVGDFTDHTNRFKAGQAIEALFSEKDVQDWKLAAQENAAKRAAAAKKDAEKTALDKAKLQAELAGLRTKLKGAKGDGPAEQAIAKKIAGLEKAQAEKALAEQMDREQRAAMEKDRKPEPQPLVGAPVFQEKWTLGLIDWWNAVVKDATPKWAAEITTIPEHEIVAVARELGSTRPAMVLTERGAVAHYNGVYNGMALTALNALIGAYFAKGGVGYHQGVPWGKVAAKPEDYLDEYAKAPERKKPRIDMAKTDRYPLAGSVMQDVPRNHLKGAPYKLDTLMLYMTSPVFSAPESRDWEKAMAEIFVIDTSPAPSESSHFADLILPESTYLERLQINGGTPFQGYPIAMIRNPAIKPLYDTKVFSDMLIELGKRLQGKSAEYFKKLENTENVVRQLAAGFAEKPGSNGVDGYESFVKKGVWFKKPYGFRQIGGEFFEWDGLTKSYSKPMTAQAVKDKLFKTPSGKFEFKSGYILDEHYAHYAAEKMGIPQEMVGYPQYIPVKYFGGGDLHFITPKLAGQSEGRSGNLPHVSAMIQPAVGGKRDVFLEIHPDTAAKRHIADGDRVRIRNEVGSIEAIARHFNGIRPDTVVLPMIHGHWGMGRWAQGRLPSGSVNEVVVNVSEPFAGLICVNSTTVFVEKV